MKKIIAMLISGAAVFSLFGCTDGAKGGTYSLRLPEPPAEWTELMGSPEWRIEWLDSGGTRQAMNVRHGSRPEIRLPETYASAVTAWPHWPRRDIRPRVFMPAGAMYPFDVNGGTLALRWEAGVDVVLFWELANAAARDSQALAAATPRLPHYFNWPRFRELFTDADSGLAAEIRADPWLADWHSIAEKIAHSGFDKRRLVPEAREQLPVALDTGLLWIGTSPFAPPKRFTAGAVPVFPVRQGVDVWVSARGILRCNKKSWIFLEQ